MLDHRLIEGLMEAIAPVILGAIAPLHERIKALEARPIVEGSPGIDGKDGAPGERGERGERGEQGPQGERGGDGTPGEKGINGKDGAPGALGPTGLTGERGAPGINGSDGKDAAPPSRDEIAVILREMPDIIDLVKEVARAHLTANPPQAGERGPQGEKGDPARDGRDGLPGVPGLPGEKGIDGKDGLGIDDYEEIFEDGGRIEVRRFMRGGEVVKEIRHQRADIIYREQWRPQGYLKGDAVTYSGSIFVAMRDTSDKPESSDAWRLAVKRGRDGKDGQRPPPDTGPVKLR